jgi:uncharacterized protein (UPF0128 family)
VVNATNCHLKGAGFDSQVMHVNEVKNIGLTKNLENTVKENQNMSSNPEKALSLIVQQKKNTNKNRGFSRLFQGFFGGFEV